MGTRAKKTEKSGAVVDNGTPRKATKCPITREQFKRLARLVPVTIGGQPIAAGPKEFRTGSFGWANNVDKVHLVIEGVEGPPIKVQVGLILTIVNSKDA